MTDIDFDHDLPTAPTVEPGMSEPHRWPFPMPAPAAPVTGDNRPSIDSEDGPAAGSETQATSRTLPI